MSLLRSFCAYPALLTLAVLGGCATTSAPSTSTPVTTTPSSPANATPPADVTGNWQGSLVAASGTSSLTAIAGSIHQYGPFTSVTQFTSAVLHVTGTCFTESPILPLQGTNNGGGQLILDSYTVNGQTLHLSGTPDSTGSTMTGGYTATGSCAAGAAGTFTATRYQPVTGTFTGTVTATGAASNGPVVSLALTQAADTTGSGTFLLSGTLTLAGTGCSLAATAPAAEESFIQGSALQVAFAATDGSAATASLTATTEPTGKHLTPFQLTVQGGTCAGVYTTGTLARP